MRKFALIVALAAGGCTPAMQSPGEPTPEIAPGPGSIEGSRVLIREMHDRYAGKWYRTLRFEQTNTFYTQSGKEEKSQWIENLSVPGRLRIDFLPLTSRSGLLILNNRVTSFDNGRRMETRRSIQPLLTLTADVYAIPASVTIRRIDSLGIDLEKFYETRWEGKRTYVIGAESGDVESSQIWIDANRLLLVRLVQRERRGERVIVTDTRVGDYREVDGFPVAYEFLSYRDGKPFFREKYDNVRVNEPIPPRLFDPSRWATAQQAGL
ncbi:MAG: hypothetical protein ABIR58_03540 [Gemmatimonadaceae bacterium]